MPVLLPLPDLHLSQAQAALRLGVSRHRVLAFSAAGVLTATRMGGRLFFATEEVEALAHHLTSTKSPPATKRVRARP